MITLALEIDWSSLVSRHLPFPVDGLVFDERLTFSWTSCVTPLRIFPEFPTTDLHNCFMQRTFPFLVKETFENSTSFL